MDMCGQGGLHVSSRTSILSTVLHTQPIRRFTSAVRTFGNGFVKRHDKSLLRVVDAVVVLYQQQLAGASGGQKLNALQEIAHGQ